MLRYFVILKCEVGAREGGAGAHEAVARVAVAGAKGDVLQDALQ